MASCAQPTNRLSFNECFGMHQSIICTAASTTKQAGVTAMNAMERMEHDLETMRSQRRRRVLARVLPVLAVLLLVFAYFVASSANKIRNIERWYGALENKVLQTYDGVDHMALDVTAPTAVGIYVYCKPEITEEQFNAVVLELTNYLGSSRGNRNLVECYGKTLFGLMERVNVQFDWTGDGYFDGIYWAEDKPTFRDWKYMWR